MQINQLTQMLLSKNIDLYRLVRTQTSQSDQTSLLELLHLVRGKSPLYVYLEIGSFLGGTLVPFCVDVQCKAIYSVDKRVYEAPNESRSACSEYGEHSSSAMRQRLLEATGFDANRLKCLDSDMRDVASAEIKDRIDYVLIDGEHTNDAVESDFRAVERFLASDAVVAFHDYHCVRGGIVRIEKYLRATGRTFLSVKLSGDVFAIFMQPEMARSSTFVKSYIRKYRWLRIRHVIMDLSPRWFLLVCRRINSIWRNSRLLLK